MSKGKRNTKYAPVQIGDVFEKWTVTGDGNASRVECRCECGATKLVRKDHLKSGASTKCEVCSTVTHGQSRSSEYRSWDAMIQRCTNPKNIGYLDYGGRGITVCERWTRFENFIADMGRKPSQKHSIERKDSDGNYEPDNCRWATPTEQSRNTSRNIRLTLNGVTKCLCEWADELGIQRATLQYRVHAGWSDEKTLMRPVKAQ